MADYTKSPVFSSPAYWIALGVGVVGIGAAALQERRGSAARYTVRDRNRPDMIFDPDIPKKITLHSEYFFGTLSPSLRSRWTRPMHAC